MQPGDNLPSFPFTATQGINANFDDYRGQWLVLYFYPKDATPGCTIEGENFRDAYTQFSALNTVVFGISRDKLSSHERFKTKHAFPFELIDDVDERLCQLFDVIKMKNMYGKTVRGIQRSTFLFNPEGVLKHAWRKVVVEGHVADVLATLQRETSL